jgi:translation initiation factor RLI1
MKLPGKMAMVQFDKCVPHQCKGGKCTAIPACKHKLIQQEKAGEIPMFSPGSCTGCGDCVRACPLKAIQIYRV